jgi:small conductance mechanosensitive channel
MLKVLELLQRLGAGALYLPLTAFLRVVLIVVVALIAARLADRLIRTLKTQLFGTMIERARTPRLELEKRAATIAETFRRTVAVAIYLTATMMVLREVGLDIRPLLVSAGVVGLAVGFGAQNLVRDVISGIFLLLDNEIRIGDLAIINGTPGIVERINLRTTALRANDGTVHVFRNGAINTLSNMTREYSYYVFNIRVPHAEDPDRVFEILRGIGDEIASEEPYRFFILEPLEVLGIDQFTDTGMVIQARIKTQPLQQWVVGREMNRRIKKTFDRAGIQMRP